MYGSSSSGIASYATCVSSRSVTPGRMAAITASAARVLTSSFSRWISVNAPFAGKVRPTSLT